MHLHSFSQFCGLTHARAAKEADARLVVTVHTPSYSCANGTLIDGFHSAWLELADLTDAIHV